MSAKHPIIAVTGSSGAGTTTTSEAFRKMFNMMNVKPAWVEGDSFHRFTRPEMDIEIRKAREQGKHISYFGPQANDFPGLEKFFSQFGIHTRPGRSRPWASCAMMMVSSCASERSPSSINRAGRRNSALAAPEGTGGATEAMAILSTSGVGCSCAPAISIRCGR